MRSSRIAAAAAALLLSIAAFAGCAASPGDVTATPTPMFASDEEAFAAAEATYRAYVDALNAHNADAASLPRPTDFLTNPLYQADLDYSRELNAQGKTPAGEFRFRDFNLIGVEPQKVVASVCLDVTGSRMIGPGGDDLTAADRDAVVPLMLTFVESEQGLLISESLGYPEGVRCAM